MKLDIDTEAARATHVAALNEKASAFIIELEDRLDDLTTTEQSALIDHLTVIVSNKDSAGAIVASNYAQQSNGQPAAALGSGSSSGSTEDDALQAIMTSTSLPQGVKAAILRVITPSDPAFMDVESDGTPKALRAAERERDVVKAELANERDESRNGSLAHRLAEAQAAAAVPTNLVGKTEVKAAIRAVKSKVNELYTGMMTTRIENLDELERAVEAAETLVS
ncbi:hypothetical protein H6796_00875 [Candidatus Nomurabacteria bacterium]|nr:hypothetical protein [Candidatus Nomurabacteria bacterium]